MCLRSKGSSSGRGGESALCLAGRWGRWTNSSTRRDSDSQSWLFRWQPLPGQVPFPDPKSFLEARNPENECKGYNPHLKTPIIEAFLRPSLTRLSRQKANFISVFKNGSSGHGKQQEMVKTDQAWSFRLFRELLPETPPKTSLLRVKYVHGIDELGTCTYFN